MAKRKGDAERKADDAVEDEPIVADDAGTGWPPGFDPEEDDRITRELRAARLARLGR